MSDHHGPSVPPIPGPGTPPAQRSGCATAIMVLVGIVLLLPGLCVILLVSMVPGHFGREEFQLVIFCGLLAAGGIALIGWAVRRP